jgi:HSP20 family protein
MLLRSTHTYTVFHVHSQQTAWQPPTDVYETETSLVIQLEVAGMRDGHFHVSLHDRTLVVSGARLEPVRERRAYYQLEVNNGDFRSEVELPVPVSGTDMRAEYEDGFLRITLPKPR